MYGNVIKMTTITIPGAFLNDAYEAMAQIAAEGDDGYAALMAKIDAAEERRCGKGYRVRVDLTDEEFEALASEVKYRDRYWNTDDYGIKEAGSTIRAYANAARTMARRVAEAKGVTV